MIWRKVGWEWGKDCHVVLLHIVMNCVHSSESEITVSRYDNSFFTVIYMYTIHMPLATPMYVHHSQATPISYTFLVSDYWSSTATLSYWGKSHFNSLVKQHFNWGYFNDDCIHPWCQLEEHLRLGKKTKTLDIHVHFCGFCQHSFIQSFFFPLGVQFWDSSAYTSSHTSRKFNLRESQRQAKIWSCMHAWAWLLVTVSEWIMSPRE